MNLEPWLLGMVGFLLLAHIAITAVAFRQFKLAQEDSAIIRGDSVECLECGVDNDIEYRFCQECITEFPGQSPTTGSRLSSTRGRLLN
jgi:hypothetical protein